MEITLGEKLVILTKELQSILREYFSSMDNIIMDRLMAKQNERKESLGTFLSKKAKMLREQRIKDGIITQEIKGDISA